jgi:hypothetical protein
MKRLFKGFLKTLKHNSKYSLDFMVVKFNTYVQGGRQASLTNPKLTRTGINKHIMRKWTNKTTGLIPFSYKLTIHE